MNITGTKAIEEIFRDLILCMEESNKDKTEFHGKTTPKTTTPRPLQDNLSTNKQQSSN